MRYIIWLDPALEPLHLPSRNNCCSRECLLWTLPVPTLCGRGWYLFCPLVKSGSWYGFCCPFKKGCSVTNQACTMAAEDYTAEKWKYIQSAQREVWTDFVFGTKSLKDSHKVRVGINAWIDFGGFHWLFRMLKRSNGFLRNRSVFEKLDSVDRKRKPQYHIQVSVIPSLGCPREERCVVSSVRLPWPVKVVGHQVEKVQVPALQKKVKIKFAIFKCRCTSARSSRRWQEGIMANRQGWCA